MTLKLNLSDLQHMANSEPAPNRIVYRAEPCHDVGLTEGNTLVTGVQLVPYYVEQFDFVHEEISQVGTDAVIHLPEGGLALGELYDAYITNVSHDWESGHIDDFEITFRHTEDDPGRNVVDETLDAPGT